jgi:hypothetical protein
VYYNGVSLSFSGSSAIIVINYFLRRYNYYKKNSAADKQSLTDRLINQTYKTNSKHVKTNNVAASNVNLARDVMTDQSVEKHKTKQSVFSLKANIISIFYVP